MEARIWWIGRQPQQHKCRHVYAETLREVSDCVQQLYLWHVIVMHAHMEWFASPTWVNSFTAVPNMISQGFIHNKYSSLCFTTCNSHCINPLSVLKTFAFDFLQIRPTFSVAVQRSAAQSFLHTLISANIFWGVIYLDLGIISKRPICHSWCFFIYNKLFNFSISNRPADFEVQRVK